MHNQRTLTTLVFFLGALAMTAPAALATDGVVTWNLTVEPTTIDAGATSKIITWRSSVVVTGDNQGLASFVYGVGVKDSAGNWIKVTLDKAQWETVYAVAGASGKPTEPATIPDEGNVGGPGMKTFPSVGYNDKEGYLSQCAGSYPPDWDPWRKGSGTAWTGSATWGVGLDSRKGTLLANPSGAYLVQFGTVDVSSLAAGTYTVVLIPDSAKVLNAGVDLSKVQSAGFSTTVPKASINGASATFTVGVAPSTNKPPTGVVTTAPSPATGFKPLAVAFDAGGSSDPDGDTLSYAWDFGDGQSGSGVSVSHTYTTVGSFTARLTVTDGKGGTDTKTVAVTVQQPVNPTAEVTASPTSGVAPLTVVFNGNASSDPNGYPLTYTWDFGDGQRLENGAPTVFHTYSNPGTYTAALTVDNGHNGRATKTLTITVTGNSAPTARIAVTPSTTGEAPLRLSFDGGASTDPDGDPLKYTWGFGDVTFETTARVVSNTFTVVGPHVVTLTVTDGRGGTGFAQTQIIVTGTAPTGTNPPTAVAAANPTSGKAALKVDFNGSGSNVPAGGSPNMYVWDFGDGYAAVGINVSYMYTTPGRYLARLTINDKVNPIATATVPITVYGSPTAAATATPTSGNAPLTVVFNAAGSSDPLGDELTYAWAFGDGQTGTGPTVSHTYATNGKYTATLTVTAGGDAARTATKTLAVAANGAPTAVATATHLSGTAPLNVGFSAAGSTDPDGDSLTYAWDFGDGQSGVGETPSHTYTGGGVYTVTLTADDGHGSKSTQKLTITVNGPPVPFAFVSPTSGTVPLTISFTANNSSDPDGDTLVYAWDFGDGGTSTATYGDHTYTATGTYTVTLTISDNHGGTQATTRTVTVSAAPTPRPNDDTGVQPFPFALCGAGISCHAIACAIALFVVQCRRRVRR